MFKEEKNENKEDLNLLKIDFSLRREVFYVVVGAVIGALTMLIPKIIYDTINGIPYYVMYIIFGHIIGVFSPNASIAGLTIHIITATSIGIVTGIFLYKSNILNISKRVNGLLYGVISGTIIFIVWYIPVNQFILMPENIRTLSDMNPLLSEEQVQNRFENARINIMINSFIMHITFGVTLGIVSSLLSIRFGTRYRCPFCSISFSRINSIQKHINLVHGKTPIDQKKVLILGGGFGGVECLRKFQNAFRNDVRVDITLVSKDNFFLFTPMLHEVASGMIETRHVAVPLRSFCKRARFIEADVRAIDLENNNVKITNQLFKNFQNVELKPTIQQIIPTSSSLDTFKEHTENQTISNYNFLHDVMKSYSCNNQHEILEYDYLVLALGSKTNFFGNSKIKDRSFTMKNLYDAFFLRSHIISTLEQADALISKIEYETRLIKQYQETKKEDKQEGRHSYDNFLDQIKQSQKSLTTYVVVGGGFAGVESIGELNDFIRESIKEYYHNINPEDIRIILVSSGSSILPEMSESIGKFALERLHESKVEIILNNRVVDVKKISDHKINNNNDDNINNINYKMNSKIIVLKDGTEIISNTLIWTAGVTPEEFLTDLDCEHDKKGSIITNEYLQIKKYSNSYAIGDCASILDPETGNPYPPTAQHAKKEGVVAAENIIRSIKNDFKNKNHHQRKKEYEKNQSNLIKFSYKTRGIMATIGKRKGVAVIFGHSVMGISAWWIWRLFYLTNLPSFENRVRVIIDWTIDILFGRNITRLKSPIEIRDIVPSDTTNKKDKNNDQKEK